MTEELKGHSGKWCVHYKAPRPDQSVTLCGAGIDMNRWFGIKFDVRPCFLVRGQSKPGALECESIRRPTVEEIALDKKEWSDHLEKITKALKVVSPWRKANKGRSHQEVIECPICAGKLHLSSAAANGHVHAMCETLGCVSWVE